ncbi:MAG: cysteine desulfurase-like protein [Candidatus Sumerlaeaceae bacterium]|nr:cysteine desulfurase-like protein [Candidatus Sumerlaeaceae bacterium]
MTTTTSAANTSIATPDQIRTNFPALNRRHAGHPVAYFDGPGGTQVPRQVTEAISDYLLNHNANTHWTYPTSAETDAIITAGRAALADFLNATPDEIAFGANMTTLTFHLARGLGRAWGPGDEVVITELDHHANVAPWTRIAAERGATIRVVKMIPETGQLDYADLERAITPRTKLLAMGAASNALGTINDLKRGAALAHAVGALFFVDAVHYAPHELVDVRDLGCDFLCCSAYKFYGPHIGILYGRHDLLGAVDFPKLIPAPDTAPEIAETGTQNHEGIAGATAAVDFLANLAPGANRRARLEASFANLHARGIELVTQLWQGLASINGVRLFGPEPHLPRTPTVSFTLDGINSTDLSRRLADHGLFASNGDFYAKTVIDRLAVGPHGLLRAGCACYATADEVQRLITAVKEIANKK